MGIHPSCWPNGARAAVSFTYDDGRESQLDVAMRDLEDFGVRGTFFVTPDHFNVRKRASNWAAAHRRGHEVMNHTISHSRNYDTCEAFFDEQITPCEEWLDKYLGADRKRCFAYPEGKCHLRNGMDYSDLIRKSFAAARVADGGISSADLARMMPHKISSRATTWGNECARDSIEFLNTAKRIDMGWLVLCFHGVTDNELRDHAETCRKVHRELIEFTTRYVSKLWVAPFGEVFGFLTNTFGEGTR